MKALHKTASALCCILVTMSSMVSGEGEFSDSTESGSTGTAAPKPESSQGSSSEAFLSAASASSDTSVPTTYRFKLDGPSPGSGLLLAAVPGSTEYGTVCSFDFDAITAVATCATLGYDVPYAQVTYNYPGGANFSTALSGIHCTAGAASLADCIKYPKNTICDLHTLDIGLDCTSTATTTWQFRIDPTLPTDPWRGRLGVLPSFANKTRGTWGTVCTDGFDDVAALAVCRSLGYKNISQAYALPWYGGGQGTIYVDDIDCVPGDEYFQNCSYTTSSQAKTAHDCEHWEDVGLDCSGAPRPVDAVIAFNATISTSASANFTSNLEQMLYINTTYDRVQVLAGPTPINTITSWIVFRFLDLPATAPRAAIRDLTLQPRTDLDYAVLNAYPEFLHFFLGIYNFTTNITDSVKDTMEFRLVGGNRGTLGAVEVRSGPDAVWGTVCDDGFTQDEANAVCHSLGFQGIDAKMVTNSGIKSKQVAIRVDDAKCQENDYFFQNCSFTWSTATNSLNNCHHDEDLVLDCAGLQGWSYKLEGQPSLPSGSGLLLAKEYENSPWGTVCGNGFSDSVAVGFCRTLGYPTATASILTLIEGATNLSVVANGVACWPNPTSVSSCRTYPYVGVNCDSSRAIGLNCNPQINLQFKIEPVRPSMPWRGRLTVLPSYASNDQFGTVCSDGFDDVAALAVCRSLGYNNISQAYAIPYYGGGSGTIYVDDTMCEESDRYFQNCTWSSTSTSINNGNCEHWEDVGVDCSGSVRPADAVIVFTIDFSSVYQTTIVQRLAYFLAVNATYNPRILVVSGPEATASTGVLTMQFRFLDLPESAPQRVGLQTRSDLDYTMFNTPSAELRYWLGIYNLTSNITDSVKTTMQFRLTGGTQTSGVVEVRSGPDAAWGTMCDDGFGQAEALAVCHSLGFSSTSVSVGGPSAKVQSVQAFIRVDQARCGAGDFYFQNCSWTWSTATNILHNCDHTEDVVVDCNASIPQAPTSGDSGSGSSSDSSPLSDSGGTPSLSSATTHSQGTPSPGESLKSSSHSSPTVAPRTASSSGTQAPPLAGETKFTATVNPQTFNEEEFKKKLADLAGTTPENVVVSTNGDKVSFFFVGDGAAAATTKASDLLTNNAAQQNLGISGMAAVGSTSAPAPSTLNIPLVAGIAAAGALLIALVVVVVCKFKQGSKPPHYDADYLAMQDTELTADYRDSGAVQSAV